MPTYPMPPGAWLSGGNDAGLRPVTPPGGSHRPVTPPGSSHRPVTPPWGYSAEDTADLRPVTPPGAPRARGAVAAAPWEGADPDWVYEDSEALLGQALRKTRAKLLRAASDQLTTSQIAAAQETGKKVGGSHLWRWDTQFRIETVVAELAGRFQVRGSSLWMFDPGPGAVDAPPVLSAHEVFRIGPLGNDFGDQVDKVLRAAVEREDRLPEILSQAKDFWPFFESVVNIHLESAPRFRELLTVAQDWAMRLLMGLKHGVAARRPMQWSSLVMPVIPTPGHGSLPSGHATVSALNAELLRILLYRGTDTLSTDRARMLDRLARRIAFNRVVAGVHFPVDSLVGYALGAQLARALAALAGAEDAAFPKVVDDAVMSQLDPDTGKAKAGLLGKTDRELPELGGLPLPEVGSNFVPAECPNLKELWKRAGQELTDLRV